MLVADFLWNFLCVFGRSEREIVDFFMPLSDNGVPIRMAEQHFTTASLIILFKCVYLL